MDNKQFIICCDDYSIRDILLQQQGVKTCECVYYIHESCTNPTCPYCKDKLHLEESISIIDITKDDISINLDQGNTSLKYVEKSICIRKCLICVCIILLISFLSNILFN